VTVNLRLGDVMPLLTSATGLCFAAYAPEEAIRTRLKEEMARAQKQGRTDLPATLAEARTLLEEVRKRGASRVVETLLPGVVGFCVPVFDSDGHMALGVIALGPVGSFDAEWGGAVEKPLRAAAARLSSDLGYRG
jgi:DNA-binding IclR family transcriptional regulator